MFAWLWHCCTPDLRKRDPPLVGRPIKSNGRPLDLDEKGIVSFSEEIKILTYNIFMRPDIPVSSSTEYQDYRAGLFINHVLPNYDIVCLQEMFNLPLSTRRHEFIEDARSRGFQWHHASSRTHSLSPSIDGGLLILSKLPIVRKDVLNFSSAAFADWYATKGVLYALVKVGPKEPHYIHLFCTHLQATYDEVGKEESERVRKDQITQTVAFIKKCVFNREEWPIIICGDLNVQCRKSGQDGSDSKEYLDMLSIFTTGFGVRGNLIRDLAKEIDGSTHPITYADAHVDDEGNIKLKETSLNDVESLKQSTIWCNQSLDKIFFIPPAEVPSPIEPKVTRVNPIIIQKELWNMKDETHLTHLSDHYAIETDLRVRIQDLNTSMKTN